MKTIIFLLLFFLFLSACTAKQNSNSNKNSVSTFSEKVLHPSDKKHEKSLLSGVWWDANEKDAPYAVFEINDSTIIYPDQEEQSEFKYEFKNDSLIVYYDGYLSASKIEKVTTDSLVLISDGIKQVLIKR